MESLNKIIEILQCLLPQNLYDANVIIAEFLNWPLNLDPVLWKDILIAIFSDFTKSPQMEQYYNNREQSFSELKFDIPLDLKHIDIGRTDFITTHAEISLIGFYGNKLISTVRPYLESLEIFSNIKHILSNSETPYSRSDYIRPIKFKSKKKGKTTQEGFSNTIDFHIKSNLINGSDGTRMIYIVKLSPPKSFIIPNAQTENLCDVFDVIYTTLLFLKYTCKVEGKINWLKISTMNTISELKQKSIFVNGKELHDMLVAKYMSIPIEDRKKDNPYDINYSTRNNTVVIKFKTPVLGTLKGKDKLTTLIIYNRKFKIMGSIWGKVSCYYFKWMDNLIDSICTDPDLIYSME
jgi:hypothetical protein